LQVLEVDLAGDCSAECDVGNLVVKKRLTTNTPPPSKPPTDRKVAIYMLTTRVRTYYRIVSSSDCLANCAVGSLRFKKADTTLTYPIRSPGNPSRYFVTTVDEVLNEVALPLKNKSTECAEKLQNCFLRVTSKFIRRDISNRVFNEI